jgi:hypothetical protein
MHIIPKNLFLVSNELHSLTADGFLKRLPGVDGERTRGLSVSFIFFFSPLLPLSHSCSPKLMVTLL